MLAAGYDTLVEALDDFRKKGYDNEFSLKNDKLFCHATQEFFDSNEVKIIEHHRFEGESNPGDMAVVFAIECGGINKGVVVSSYGTYADEELLKFLDKAEFPKKEKVRPADLRN